ncbi:MAG: NADH-quinone oxidoreductase subunit M [Opitutaceae bacterium]
MSALPTLSLIVFLPWAGALLLALMPGLGARGSRATALAFSLSTLALSAVVLGLFNPATAGYQLAELHDWIPSLNVHFSLGLDGLSLILVLLTAIIGPAGLLASWRQERDPRLMGIFFLVLQGSALGVFLALDFVPWFMFWELSLVPAYFLIKLWGGPGAPRAAYQFVVYTIGGSAFMLMGFAAIFLTTGTLDFPELSRLAADGTLASKLATLGGFWPHAVFLGVFLGLAVKVPLFPFHSWLPSAYAEAPVGASMFLTGVMSKMGVYGFLRILWPLFPAPLHAASPCLIWLAVAGVVFGAFAAMKQSDLKRMVAYSSINHVSYCLLALFAVSLVTRPGGSAATSALAGALLQMFNHGVSAAALFFCVGVLESRSGGRRGLGDFGGVRTAAPIFAGFCGISLFSSLGLPGLNGFVGEFLIFRGVWGLAPWCTAVACLGLFATAFFLLTFWQRVFHGPRTGAAAGAFSDLSRLEIATLVPLVALMFLFGVLPQLLTGLFNPLVAAWVGHLPLP